MTDETNPNPPATWPTPGTAPAPAPSPAPAPIEPEKSADPQPPAPTDPPAPPAPVDAKTQQAIDLIMTEGASRETAEKYVAEIGAEKILAFAGISDAPKVPMTHAPECGDVGETGEHGELGENAAK